MDLVAAARRREACLQALEEAIRVGSIDADHQQLLRLVVPGIRARFACDDQRNLLCVHLPMLIGELLGAAAEPLAGVAAACTALYGGARLLDDLLDGHATSYFEEAPTHDVVLAGATMLGALGYHVLAGLKVPSARRVELVRELASGALRMSAGQQLEAAGMTRIGSVDEILAVAQRKSGAMAAAFCACGAIAAGGRRTVVSACSRFGALLGVARQMATDVTELATGADTDVHAGVATLPVSLRAAGLSGGERDAFVRRFAAAGRSELAHRQLVDELSASGALAAAQLYVETMIAAASVALSDIGASSSTRNDLLSIVEFGSHLMTKGDPDAKSRNREADFQRQPGRELLQQDPAKDRAVPGRS